MGKSFVLKDTAGHPRGYLLQQSGKICCRASLGALQARLVMLFEDGTQMQHEMQSDGTETSWPCDARKLCGGYACAENRLLLFSDEEARRAFERARIRQKAVRTAAEEDGYEPKEEQSSKEPAPAPQETAAGEATIEERLPQRRWPPPPCWPTARYVHGSWQENEKA